MFHFKKEACVCVRCNRNYKDLIALGEHMKQCPYPPPNRPPIQYTDPEDGIDIKTDNILKSRKSNEQINNWRTLWETLFPTDPVPCSDFEPVVEDHDLVYNYKRTQSQIAQRLDALGLGPSHEKVKSSIFEEIETLLRCGSSNDQYPTPSSNSNTSPIQPLPREIEIATLEKETSLAAYTTFSADHMVPTFNHEELRSPMQFDIRNTFEANGVTEPSSTSAIPQPSTRYYPRMEPESQSFISLLPEPTQPLEEMAEDIAGLPIRDIGLDMLQSSAQPQLASSLGGTTSFRFPETPQDNQWNLSNNYAFIGNDPNTQWPDSSGGFGDWGINNAEC
ncbi:hypothetical protein F5Y01DRAFT_322914 [Xylaria sp. FL0043]|nr:hypothetical protein F5Y01DRAFT_322914 [Xylaria sp. FL0043]